MKQREHNGDNGDNGDNEEKGQNSAQWAEVVDVEFRPGLSLFPAEVIAEAGEHGNSKGPAFRSQLDGKIGFVRNWVERDLRKGQIVMVEIEQSSQKHYAEYSYWIGRIVKGV